MSSQYCDPNVSRTKFDREVSEYRSVEAEYLQRGWLMLRAAFPQVLVAFAVPKLKPAPIVFGVSLDFTNYDAAPPSVRIVNPFTGEAYRMKELPTQLNRALPQQQIPIPGLPENQGMLTVDQVQPYMQANSPDEVPFLCLAGVREYHAHPAHSGDIWELHRAQGAGRLVRILEVIHRYGVEPINGLKVNMVPQVSLNYGAPPA